MAFLAGFTYERDSVGLAVFFADLVVGSRMSYSFFAGGLVDVLIDSFFDTDGPVFSHLQGVSKLI